MRHSLTHDYPGVGSGRNPGYGGNQRWLRDENMQHCGCGVIAALDLVRYLHLYRPGFRSPFFTGTEDDAVLPRPVYDLCAQRMRRSFVPILPPIGTNGLSLAAGLNRYFRRYRLPMTARWGVPAGELWQQIGTMLDSDLPVILSVGNRFPRFWSKDAVSLYRPDPQEGSEAAARIHGHFIVVTGMDARWLRVSSWGRMYYINKEEFSRYCRKDSLSLLCNMILLQPRETR